MALNIKDAETDRLARELAAATGESITTATRTALRERLARERRIQGRRGAAVVVADIIARGRQRTTTDERSEDQILGYDEHGMPR